MTTTNQNPNIVRFTREQQGVGSFEGGKITEFKPIPFPQERGGSPSVGPLFYWVWSTARGDGKIPMHPHQGFEILSYTLRGEMGHTDSLGGHSRVANGGVQVMQTGSGISHQEEMFGDHTEFFQIWFDPDLRKALSRKPTYAGYADSDFPRETQSGAVIKTIVGGGGPIRLEADASVKDVVIEPGGEYKIGLLLGRVLAVVVIDGDGRCGEGKSSEFGARDFMLVQDAELVEFRAGKSGLRLVIVEVPREVDYPLFSGR